MNLTYEATPASELDIRWQAELIRLHEALAVEVQRFDVAVAIAGLLDDRVDDPEDLATVIHDVVRQWRRLDPTVQRQYADPTRPRTALTAFAWEYVNRVALSAFADLPEEERSALSTADCLSLEIGHWRAHVARCRQSQRQAENEASH